MNEFILKYQGKELKMPEWCDAGNEVFICKPKPRGMPILLDGAIHMGRYCKKFWTPEQMADKIKPWNDYYNAFNNPLRINTTHELNTKFNGLFKGCVYGEGNDVAVKMQIIKISNHTYKNGDVVSTWIDGVYAVVRWSDYFNGWALFCYKKEYEGNNDIPFSVCNLTPEMIDKIVIKGNLLDEYFEGKNELAKMVGFD